MTHTANKMKKVYLYSRFERFWHWFQAIVILTLMVTGFEIHGSFQLFGFELAADIHNYTGIAWLSAFAFFVFWLVITNEWKQYIPTSKKMMAVVRYYGIGIFKGETHPVQKRPEAKHNPLQRLTYLGLSALLLPLQMLTGAFYYLYNFWQAVGIPEWLTLQIVALLHLICAFALVSFLIVHVYMTTTGHSIFAHVKAMVSGWEEIEDEADVAEWEKARQPHG